MFPEPLPPSPGIGRLGVWRPPSTSKTSAAGPLAPMARRSASGCAQQDSGKASHPTADVVIVNTCSVTAEADRAARAYIRRTHRLNPEARIVVTGCYAQRAPDELAGMDGVAAVVGNSHKSLAPEIAADLAHRSRPNPPANPELLVPISSLSAPIWADDRFAHSFLEEAQVAARRPDPAQPQNPGRLLQPLHVLRNSANPRLFPKSARRSRPSPGGGLRRRGRKGTGALGNQPRPLGPRSRFRAGNTRAPWLDLVRQILHRHRPGAPPAQLHRAHGLGSPISSL